MFLRKKHPWNPGYAIPKYVLTEGSYAKVTPQLPRGTGKDKYIGPMPMAPRGTTYYQPQPELVTGKAALGDYGGIFQKSSSQYGSLGSLVGDQLRPNYGSLGNGAGMRIHKGKKCCFNSSRNARRSLGDTIERVAGSAPGSGAVGIGLDGVNGHPVVITPDAAITGQLTGNELSLWNRAQTVQMGVNPTLAMGIRMGSAPYRNASVGGVEYQIRYNGSKVWLTKQMSVSSDLATAGKIILSPVIVPVSAVIDEARKLGCFLSSSAAVAAAIAKHPAGTPAATIAKTLCGTKSDGTPVPTLPEESAGIGPIALLGAAVIGAFFYLRNR